MTNICVTKGKKMCEVKKQEDEHLYEVMRRFGQRELGD